MESLKEKVDLKRLPRHVAVIMDGNGRWAKMHGKPRLFGHRSGVSAVREVTEASAELRIGWLTLYAFSTENWSRPRLEVNALMSLLVETLHKEIETLQKNDIRLNAIGDLERLPSKTHKALHEAIAQTAGNKRMRLTLALNYSSRWEILEAVKTLATRAKEGKLDPSDIGAGTLAAALKTADMPDPELMIRTSGEHRISNFLLWQIAYAELYFTPVFWPDFTREELYKALIDFQGRERRFGMTSEQLV